MPVRFHKMHGAGNDFMLLDLRTQSFQLDSQTVAGLADRHTGIGFDQLLVLKHPRSPGCLAAFEVWNADGSRAEQCGNGVRCIGLYLYQRAEPSRGVFSIQGPVSDIVVEALPGDQFRVNMGVPDFAANTLPAGRAGATDDLELEFNNNRLKLGMVSMGNPHALLEVADVMHTDVDRLGAFISRNPVFPQGCNAGFAQVLDRQTIRLRVYERGAGETRACGSGACAAAAILIQKGKLDREVLVKQAGGGLIIGWQREMDSILMTGPAVQVYEGTLQ